MAGFTYTNGFFEIPTIGEIGVISAFVAYNPVLHQVVVSIRGTDSGDDVVTYPALAGIIGDVTEDIQPLIDAAIAYAISHSADVYLTGHSLGGGIAEALANANPAAFAGGAFIGSPGSSDFVIGSLNSNFVHITRDRDGVGTLFDESHAAATLTITDDAFIGASYFDRFFAAHSIDLYSFQLTTIAADGVAPALDGTDREFHWIADSDTSSVFGDTVGYDATFGGSSGDQFDASAGTHGVRFSGSLGNDVIMGTNFADVLGGGTGVDSLAGGGGNDTLYGGTNVDYLEGGAGNDLLIGGSGGDFYSIGLGQGADVIDDRGAPATDVIRFYGGSAVTSTSQFSFERSGTSMVVVVNDAVGAELMRFEIRSMGTLAGAIETLDLYAGAGDAYVASINLAQAWSNLSVVAPPPAPPPVQPPPAPSGGLTAGADSWEGTGSSDTAWGQGGNDNLQGLSGADSLLGGAGNDIIEGGDGNDVVLDDDDHVQAGNDTIAGGSGDDLLIVFGGHDTVDGGEGNDTLLVDYSDESTPVFSDGFGFIVGPGQFADATRAVHQTNIERVVVLLGSGNDVVGSTIVTNSPSIVWLPTEFHGGNGSDVLYAQGIGDIAFGDGGADEIYLMASSQAFGGEGNDVLSVSVGGWADGGLGDDTLYGGSGQSTLVGGDGNDLFETRYKHGLYWIDGGEGRDRWNGSFDLSTAPIFFDGSAAASAIGMTFEDGSHVRNVEDFGLITGSGNDYVLDGPGDDGFVLNDGDDFARVTIGFDLVQGGAGFDEVLIDYSAATTVVTSQDTNPYDLIVFDASGVRRVYLYQGVEKITVIAGSANDSLSGNEDANYFFGNGGNDSLAGADGNDMLDGGVGADTMLGGNGDDAYIVDDAGDVTTEVSALGGVDTVQSSVTRTLAANLENLILTGVGAIAGNGNALNNTITGNSAANQLFGNDGADTLDGGAGADQLSGGEGNDTIFYDSADDLANVQGGGGLDTLVFTSGEPPTSFGLVAHGFEAAEERTTDTGANAWATRTLRYDVQWRLDMVTLVNDNGTREITDYDEANSVNWSSFLTLQDALGRTTETVLTYDDGVRDTTNYDADNSVFWSSFVTRTDALGRTTETLLIHDDGTRDTTNFDADNTQFWTSFVTRRDSLGRTTESLLIHDDGTRDTTNYDADNSQFWTSFVTRRDSLGRTTESLLIHDDGTRDTTNYDADNSQFWTSFVTRRDSLGRQTESLLIHDDGTRDTTNFDPENNVFWSSFVTRRDALGRTTDTLLTYDDGRRDSTDYDEANAYNWANVVYRYDSNGVLYQTITTYDDDHVTTI